MAKLYFKYGPMGCSKTANALMTKFNYEEKNKRVLLLKPSVDTRDGADIVKSRIGLEAKAECISGNTDIQKYIFERHWSSSGFDFDVIIVDEAQFFTKAQIYALREIASFNNIPVICYGLKTNYKLELFEGSKVLFELADSIQELKTICKCGNKAIINVLKDENGNIVTNAGDSDVIIGGNKKYEAMCYKCYNKALIKQAQTKLYLVDVTLYAEAGITLTGRAVDLSDIEKCKENANKILSIICENNELVPGKYMADISIESYFVGSNESEEKIKTVSPFVKTYYEEGEEIFFYWDGEKAELYE
ncbi:MAG: thymidine kinase [Candidatus Gastranaerophilaceae bacterium]